MTAVKETTARQKREEKKFGEYVCVKNLTIRRPNIVRRVPIILHSPLSTNLMK